jgi:N6-L-threonylcarbamoyladenine synthase
MDDSGSQVKAVTKADIAGSFQAAVVDVLVEKAILAAQSFKMKKIVIGGGVSANSLFREQLTQRGKKEKIQIYFPDPRLSTDNAAMIACTGYYKIKKKNYRFRVSGRPSHDYGACPSQRGGICDDLRCSSNLNVHSSLPIRNW